MVRLQRLAQHVSKGRRHRDRPLAANQLEPDTPQREAAEKQICQFVIGTIYDPPALQEIEELNPDTVADRRLDLPRGVAPADTIRIVLVSTLATDTCTG